MSKRQALVNALEAYRQATATLVKAWMDAEYHLGELGATDYPFRDSFEDVGGEVNKWVETFTEELGDPMFHSVIMFMQGNDPNGDWLSCTKAEHTEVILETIHAWSIDSGLEITPHIQDYIDYLKN